MFGPDLSVWAHLYKKLGRETSAVQYSLNFGLDEQICIQPVGILFSYNSLLKKPNL
jgi:hypothetical protein